MEIGSTPPDPVDLDDLLQEPAQVPAVPVRTEGSVLTHELPAKRVQLATDVVPQGSWTPLLPETAKRKRACLLSTDQSFYVSTTGAGTGMLWPANQPLIFVHTQKIYVQSANVAGSTISHYSELWAD